MGNVVDGDFCTIYDCKAFGRQKLMIPREWLCLETVIMYMCTTKSLESWALENKHPSPLVFEIFGWKHVNM